MEHISVLLKETIYVINPKDNGIYVDMTLGAGGHTKYLLEKSAPNGKVIAFDKDSESIENAQKTLKTVYGDRLILVHSDYSDSLNKLHELGISEVDGIIMDIGVSSYQIDTPDRGFSFLHNGTLDMRMDKESQLTAYDIVNVWDEEDIADILKTYGEERFSKRIARKIVSSRPISTTKQLANIVTLAIPKNFYKKIHPATKTFQALRIVVNNELEYLKKGLICAIEMLKDEGVLCVISFHSLEDRIVKNIFREYKHKQVLRLINKKPIYPNEEEIQNNRRARSAKLRCVVKINKEGDAI